MFKPVLLAVLPAILARSHPLAIVGQGDIVSQSGERDCAIEQQPCESIVLNDYEEIYTAVPREGWAFESWDGCDSENNQCTFSVPAATVQSHWGQTMPPLTAKFVQVPVEVPTSEPIRILPLGDSITQGGSGYPSYRRDLWFMLQNGGYDVDFVGSLAAFQGTVPQEYFDFDMDHEGHWAWETGQVNDNLETWLQNYQADIVLMHLGTNDYDRAQSDASTKAELAEIIDKLRQHNQNVTVLMALIIPLKGRDTTSLNQHISALVGEKDLPNSRVILVDQNSGYSAATDNYDKWHPNEVGENKMAGKWFEALEPLLR